MPASRPLVHHAGDSARCDAARAAQKARPVEWRRRLSNLEFGRGKFLCLRPARVIKLAGSVKHLFELQIASVFAVYYSS